MVSLFFFFFFNRNPAVSCKMIGFGHQSSSLLVLNFIKSKAFRHGWWVTCTSPVQTEDHLNACFYSLLRVFTAVVMAAIPIKGSALITLSIRRVFQCLTDQSVNYRGTLRSGGIRTVSKMSSRACLTKKKNQMCLK